MDNATSTAATQAAPTEGANNGAQQVEGNITENQSTSASQPIENQESNQTEGSADNAIQEPTNLEEAFRMVEETNETRNSEDVSDNGTESGTNTGTPDNQTDGQNNVNSNLQQQMQQPEGNQADNQAARNAANQQGASEQRAGENNLATQIQQRAQQIVDDEYAKANVRPITLQDLQYKDENDGNIYWKNPYRQDQPYTTMKEATDFINSFNTNLKADREAKIKAQLTTLINQARPNVELRRFSQTYAAMAPEAQAVASMLTAGREIRSQNNEVVGFDVNYNDIVEKSNAIVEMVKGIMNGTIVPNGQGGFVRNQQANQQQAAQPAQPAQPAAQPTTPALDMNTSTGTPAQQKNINDIKDLNQAMMYLNELEDQKKGQQNG